MYRVLLVDVDSKIQNLALMQISAYHKAQGDIVGFGVANPDLVYISCVFSKNASQARGIAKLYPNATVKLGGSGLSYEWLPKEMQKLKPDYDLYPYTQVSIGFTTRGCIRVCPFCIVPQKEGKLHRWQHIKEFYDDRFDSVMLLDNNIYADKEWFFDNTQFAIENKLRLNISQGMDIRLLDEEIALRLKELRWMGQIRFAFDNMGDEQAVKRGVEILREAGIRVRSNVELYVLVGYNTTPEEDKYRCRLLKKLGTNPFVMKYVSNNWTNRIAWWANRKQAFWSFDIDEYDHRRHT